MDGKTFSDDPLAFGVQGHNCGYRHRSFWVWAHAFFQNPGGSPSTLETLVYDMPLGFVFRKAVLWHDGRSHLFRSLQDESASRESMWWKFRCSGEKGMRLAAEIRGLDINTHRLPYLKTDCSGSFEVSNNSLASAVVRVESADGRAERLETDNGAVLEIAGNYPPR